MPLPSPLSAPHLGLIRTVLVSVFLLASHETFAQSDPAFAQWRVQFGLSDTDMLDGDADGDGRTNQEEFEAGTHPRGFFTRYFAEGASTAFFESRLALLNPGPSDVIALLRFETGDGRAIRHAVTVPARSRRTVEAQAVPGLAPAEFSTTIEADGVVVADRLMTWGGGDGSHAETSAPSPGRTWYLAEGATHSGFDLFYLLQNANDEAARVEVRYLRPGGVPPLVKAYEVPPHARFNIWVDTEGPELASTDVSAHITSDRPILVERAMYLTTGGRLFGAGHESAGIPAPALRWFLAEGATGPYFDLFVLIANPTGEPAHVTATYLLPSGQTLSKDYIVAPDSRFNIWVDEEQFPAGSGHRLLADTAVSTIVTSTNGVPIVVERAMWWPGASSTWHEAHNSFGATTTGTRWGLAEGAVGGANETETYILIANTSASPGMARVTLLFEDGTPPAEKVVALAPDSRVNVAVASDFPEADGKRFGAVVESIGDAPAQIVVERAMYADAGDVRWAAGSNSLAMPLPGIAAVTGDAWVSGSLVSVRGAGFTPSSTVHIGGTKAPAMFLSPTELLVAIPFVAGAAPSALPEGPTVLDVDGIARHTIVVAPLPPSPGVPGASLRTILTSLEARLDADLPGAVETLQRLRTLAPDEAHRRVLDALIAAVPSVHESLRALFAELNDGVDPAMRHLVERIVLAQPSATPFLAASPQPAARVAAAALIGPPLEGDVFLAGRRRAVEISNFLFGFGYIVDFVCTVATKAPAGCAAGQVSSGLASLVFDFVAAEAGTVTALRLGEGTRPNTEKARTVLLPAAGVTLRASIVVEQQSNFGTPLKLAIAAFNATIAKRARRVPGVDQVLLDKLHALENALNSLDLLRIQVPGSTPRPGAPAPRELPISFAHVLVEPGSLMRGLLPLAKVDHTGLITPFQRGWTAPASFSPTGDVSVEEQRLQVVWNFKALDLEVPQEVSLSAAVGKPISFPLALTVSPILTSTEQQELVAFSWAMDAIDVPFITDLPASHVNIRPSSGTLANPTATITVETAGLLPGSYVGNIHVTGDVAKPGGHVVVLKVDVTHPLTGLWKGVYQYGAECSNLRGLETLDLVEQAGSVTGTLLDEILGQTFRGRVQGNFQGDTLTLNYTYDHGPRAVLTATVNGNVITGLATGVCGLGASMTFLRQ